MESNTTETPLDLFKVLGVPKTASETEIRRAFKTLITKEHPDKGGSPERFKLIKVAYDTLSNRSKRGHYEKTGKITRSAGEEFMDRFRGGSFGEFSTRQQEKEDLAEALTVLRKPDQSHTAGFEAWMRSRGENGTAVFTADSMAEQFGVNKGSYDAVPLPRFQTYKAVCHEAGSLKESVSIVGEPLQAQLDWGEVLIGIKYAPIDVADIYTAALGGTYGGASRDVPFVAGHQGVGTVLKVGTGVKGVQEDDWVVPQRSHLGTWQTVAIVKASELLVIPKECMPLEYAALSQQLCLAYRLLEDFGKLKTLYKQDQVLRMLQPGDCVALNAASSTVGQVVIQLCFTLQLRSVAVVSDHGSFDKTALWLKSLGATEVIKDVGSIRAELEQLRFFAKPKLALDAIGGASALRIADALAEGGLLVIYGCLSGKPPAWPWQSWVFKGLQVQGFNLRGWMAKNGSKVPQMLAALGHLVRAEQLRVAVTEYELATEFEEAVEHAMDRGTQTKVLLRMTDVVIAEQEDSER